MRMNAVDRNELQAEPDTENRGVHQPDDDEPLHDSREPAEQQRGCVLGEVPGHRSGLARPRGLVEGLHQAIDPLAAGWTSPVSRPGPAAVESQAARAALVSACSTLPSSQLWTAPASSVSCTR